MNPVQTLTIDHLLAVRGMTAKGLSEATGLDSSDVSRLRYGWAPRNRKGQEKARKIVAALGLNEHEVRALGWEVEDV